MEQSRDGIQQLRQAEEEAQRKVEEARQRALFCSACFLPDVAPLPSLQYGLAPVRASRRRNIGFLLVAGEGLYDCAERKGVKDMCMCGIDCWLTAGNNREAAAAEASEGRSGEGGGGVPEAAGARV